MGSEYPKGGGGDIPGAFAPLGGGAIFLGYSSPGGGIAVPFLKFYLAPPKYEFASQMPPQIPRPGAATDSVFS